MSKHKSTAVGTGTSVKMIQSVDFVPGKDVTVFFSDGTHSKIKADSSLVPALRAKENVAPNLVQITVSRGTITAFERVDFPG